MATKEKDKGLNEIIAPKKKKKKRKKQAFFLSYKNPVAPSEQKF